MAKTGQSSPGSVPQPPQTTPQEYVLSDHSGFIMQAIMEMQRTLGQLEQAVKTLTEESTKNSTKLDKISHKIYAAEAVGGVLVVIASYVLYKILYFIIPLIQLKPHP